MGESDYRQLKDMGVKSQLNFFSLTGAYGSHIRQKTEWLLNKAYYELTGGDVHGFGILERFVDKKTVDRENDATHTKITLFK